MMQKSGCAAPFFRSRFLKGHCMKNVHSYGRFAAIMLILILLLILGLMLNLNIGSV